MFRSAKQLVRYYKTRLVGVSAQAACFFFAFGYYFRTNICFFVVVFLVFDLRGASDFIQIVEQPRKNYPWGPHGVHGTSWNVGVWRGKGARAGCEITKCARAGERESQNANVTCQCERDWVKSARKTR